MASGESFQGIPEAKKEVINQEEVEVRRETIGNQLFEQYMRNVLLEHFIQSLQEDEFPQEEIEKIVQALGACSDSEILAFLAVPQEIQEQFLSKLRLEIITKKESIDVIIKERAERALSYGFGIGYHTSPYDIKSEENGVWLVRGTEKDHRDDDIPMAYYSDKYRHLFKKKHPKFIYIVRTDLAHRTDGNWSRAPSLSIITRVPFEEVYSYVENQLRRTALRKDDDTETPAER